MANSKTPDMGSPSTDTCKDYNSKLKSPKFSDAHFEDVISTFDNKAQQNA